MLGPGWQRQAEHSELADGLGAYAGRIGKLTLADAAHKLRIAWAYAHGRLPLEE